MYSSLKPVHSYEVHFISHGAKKVISVKKTSMSELDSWICAVLYICGRNNRLVAESRLRRVIAYAEAHGVTKVRWNKAHKNDSSRPGHIFLWGFYGAWDFREKQGRSTYPAQG